MAWMESAACLGHDPETWFPLQGDCGSRTRDAVAICRGCPVREECLAEGLRHESGIWGGTTERSRRKIRRARAVST